MKKYLLSFVTFNLIVALVVLLGQYLGGPAVVSPLVWKMYVFFIVLTLMGRSLEEVGLRRDPNNIVPYFFAAMGLRFMMSIAFFALFVFKVGVEGQVFTLNFFILYLSYSGFDIYCLLANLRRILTSEDNKRDENDRNLRR